MKRDRRLGGAAAWMMIVGGALGCGEGTQSSTSGSGGQGVSGSTSASSVGTGGAMSTTSAGTGGAMSTTSAGTGGAMSTTSASTGTGTGGSVPVLPGCYATCSVAADCTTPGSSLFDLDNWACTGGKCAYKGCNSTKECTDTLQSPNYVCALSPGGSFKGCYPPCSVAADCATPGSILLDVDNWACTGGKCDYTGCNSTQECTDYYQKPNYVCALTPGSSIKACLNTCATAADCVSPGGTLYDLDNWACTGGKCDYLGCQSTQECTAVFQKPNYVCD